MVSLKYVLLLPVRAVLYVLWLPFALLLLVYAFVRNCIRRIVSVPVYYLGVVRARGRLVWAWTKSHARLSLPWWGRPCTATATQTLELEVAGVSAVPALPAAGHTPPERVPLLALASSYEEASALRRRHGRSRSTKQALISYLISLLLQPSSPNVSDDEGEGPQPPPLALPSGGDEEEAEKALKLILDLVKLSKSHTVPPLEISPEESMLRSRQKASEIAALVRHARDRERLQSLIQELDELAAEVDPAVLLEAEKRAKKKPRSRSNKRLPTPRLDLLAQSESSAESSEEEEEREEEEGEEEEGEAGSETCSEEQGSVSRESTSESERASPSSPVGPDDPVERLVPDVDARPGYRSVLSPVHESPELARRSTSPESVFQLETDLNAALSQLDSETNDIRVDLEALESMEREVAQAASVLSPTSEGLARRPTSELPSAESEVDNRRATPGGSGSVVWTSSSAVHPSRSDSGVSSTEDPQEGFPGIPHTDPSLGLREGHTRRDLAITRSSYKRKLPTRKSTEETLEHHALSGSAAVEQQLQEQDTQPLEGEAPRFNPRRLVGAVPVLPPITSQIKQDIEAPEGEAPRFNPRRLIGAVPVLPPITDQIKLLKPGTYPLQETIGGRPTSASPSPSPCPSPQPVEDKALPWLDAKLQSANIESQTQNWYQTDPKVPPDVVSASRETEGEKGHEQHAGGFGVSVPLRRRSSLDAGTEVQIPKALESVPPPLPPLPLQQQPPTLPQQPKKKLMIPSGQPPWIEMVDKERKRTQKTPPPQLGVSPPKKPSPIVTQYDPSPTKETPDVPITSPPLLDPPEYYDEEEENIYDTLQPKPLFKGVTLPPVVYLHQMVTPSQVQDAETSPQLPPRNSRSRSEEKDGRKRERSASSSTERTPSRESKSSSRHSRSEERSHHSSETSKKHRSTSSESSSSKHESRDRSKSSERASSHSTEKRRGSHSSDKHSSSSKSKESESKKKHSSPSSSRKHGTTSSSSKLKESPPSKEESSRRRSSSRDKGEVKSKAEGSKSKTESSKSSSRSSKPKAEKTAEKSSKSKSSSSSSPSSKSSSKTSPSSKSSPPSSGATAKELKKSTSLNSLSSVRSHGAVSTYSLKLDGKETQI